MTKTKIFGIGLVIIGIVLVIFTMFGGTIISPPPNNPLPTKNVITCDVTINNLPLGTAEIGNYQCRIERQCLFGFSAIPLGIFGQKGDIRMIASDATVSKQYDTGFYPGTVTKSLSVCTLVKSGKLQLTDDKSNIVMEKQWLV